MLFSEQHAPPVLAALPLTLYVHVPWCARKCPYCDFNSHALSSSLLPEAAYLDALLEDLARSAEKLNARALQSVFIGGGTPSLLSAGGIARLLEGIARHFRLAEDAEFSLEANPASALCASYLAQLRASGVNRLSLGVQSFDDQALGVIGRIHDGRMALDALGHARRQFENINIDLMYGLPEQTPEKALHDIQTALRFEPDHLSVYHLTVEPHTLFAAHPPKLPDEDLCTEIEEVVHARLREAGFIHYETSAFAREGKICRHNLNYWEFGDYLGIGAGAHGKLTGPWGFVRETRPSHPQSYMNRMAAKAGSQGFVEAQKPILPSDRPAEFMMNALRLNAGFDSRLFHARTGLPLECIRPSLDEGIVRGLLETHVSPKGEDWIRPTALGRRYLNDTIAIFMA
jgi:putative oxygen-independent coproporphyrinogen III oxidase